MIGMQQLSTQPAGKKLIISLLVIALVLSLLGVSCQKLLRTVLKDGYGSLYYRLPNGFSILRTSRYINSFCYETNWLNEADSENPSNSFIRHVVRNFSVKEFGHNGRFIAVMGVHIDGDDRTSGEFEHRFINDIGCVFYILDSKDSNLYGDYAHYKCPLYGPYDTEESFLAACDEIGIGVFTVWLNVEDYPHKWE
jgi:hypothetical protein